MKATEILNVLPKPWGTIQNIQNIADLTYSYAAKVKRSIDLDFRKKHSNIVMPLNCVSTKKVIKYFDIDIGFLKSVANIKEDINEVLIVCF